MHIIQAQYKEMKGTTRPIYLILEWHNRPSDQAPPLSINKETVQKKKEKNLGETLGGTPNQDIVVWNMCKTGTWTLTWIITMRLKKKRAREPWCGGKIWCQCPQEPGQHPRPLPDRNNESNWCLKGSYQEQAATHTHTHRAMQSITHTHHISYITSSMGAFTLFDLFHLDHGFSTCIRTPGPNEVHLKSPDSLRSKWTTVGFVSSEKAIQPKLQEVNYNILTYICITVYIQMNVEAY